MRSTISLCRQLFDVNIVDVIRCLSLVRLVRRDTVRSLDDRSAHCC
jgi:hypothetical protein